MIHDPSSEPRSDDEQLQQLFDATACVPSSDQVERLLEHARRAGGGTTSGAGQRSWVRRWWPVLIPAVAASFGVGLWVAGAWWPTRTPPAGSASVVVSGESPREVVSAAPEEPEPPVSATPDPDDPDDPDDSWAVGVPSADDDWGDLDDMELLHPPESEPAQRAWLELMEEDLASGG